MLQQEQQQQPAPPPPPPPPPPATEDAVATTTSVQAIVPPLQLLTSYRHAELLRRIVDGARTGSATRDFAQRVFDDQKPPLVAFLCDLFSRITLLQPVHSRFATVFDQLCKDLRIHSAPMKAPANYTDVQTEGFIICYGSGLPRQGCFKFPLALSVEWVAKFFMATTRKFYTITELPSSFTRCLASRDYCPQLKGFIIQQLLREDSPDRQFWDNAERLSIIPPSDMLSLLYMDAHHYSAMTALESKGPMSVRIADMPKNTRALDLKPPVDAVATADSLRLHSIIYSAYLYLSYRLTSCCTPTEAKRIMQGSGKDYSALAGKLYPLLIHLLNGDHLNRDQPSLQQFFSDHRNVFDTVSVVAEEIRAFCRNPNDPTMATRYPLLLRLYQQTAAVNEVMNVYHAIRHRVAVEHRVKDLTRWVYFSASESQTLTELLLSIANELVEMESGDLCEWLKEQCSARVKPNFGMIISATFDPLKDEDPEEHFRQLNAEFAVLRFPGSGVRYYEIKLTLDYFAREYPRLFQYDQKHGVIDEAGGCQTRVWYCGCDFQGPFIIIRRRHLVMLRQLMLVTSIRSDRFAKNMPIFPVLARLYFLNHPIPENRTSAPVAAHSDVPCSNPESVAVKATTELMPSPGDFSLHCAVQIMAHWLQVPTFDSWSNRGWELRRKKKQQATPLGTAAPPSAAAAAESTVSEDQESYVPRFHDEYFSCLYFLHRLPDQLREGCPKYENFPGIEVLNAMRDFLEIRRSRRVNRRALEAIRDMIEGSGDRDLLQRHRHLLRMIQALLRAIPARLAQLGRRAATAEEEGGSDNASKKRRFGAAIAQQECSDIQLPSEIPTSSQPEHYCSLTYDEHVAKHLNDPQDLLPRLDARQRDTMMNWLFYAPILSNDLDAHFCYQLLCTNQVIMGPGAPPLNEDSFDARSISRHGTSGAEDLRSAAAQKQQAHLADYWRMYERCFTVPYSLAADGSRLPDAFAQRREPTDALIEFMKALEMRISGQFMANMLGTVNIEAEEFLAERAAPTPTVPGHMSMLPIQARLGSGELSFVYFEACFATVCLVGKDYETLKMRSALPVTTQDTSDCAIDLIMRFREKVNLPCILDVGASSRYQDFKTYMHKLEERRTHSLFDAPDDDKTRPNYTNFLQVVQAVRDKKQRVPEALAATQKKIPGTPYVFIEHAPVFSSDAQTNHAICEWMNLQLRRMANMPKNKYGLVDSGSFLTGTATRFAHMIVDQAKQQQQQHEHPPTLIQTM